MTNNGHAVLVKNVTIVVPVYGDWASLSKCIDSLKEYVGHKHTVLLVNDCGPDVEKMERNIKASINGQSNFSYKRNEENLGFVKTCNRAVFELDHTGNDILLLNSDTIVTEGFLDEMIDVMGINDRHGIVIPRSNNATIASVPLLFATQSANNRNDLEYSFKIYSKIKEFLPRFSVIPTGIGFCMLIKRELVDNFGLFDEVYGLGYHEENDFSQRVNQYGYSALLANRAFVFHLESRSFTPEKKKLLNEKNEAILLARYPYYTSSVRRYFDHVMNPVDRFADLMVGDHKKKKLLINFYHFPTAFNGTTKNGHSFLQYIKDTRLDKKYNITIFTQKAADIFHNLASYNLRTVYPDTIGYEVFDIGYCPGQVFHVENLFYMHRHCYKNLISMLDIIAVRCDYLLSNDYKLRSVFYDSLKLADSSITISNFSKLDISTYFTELDEGELKKIKPIHMGYIKSAFSEVSKTSNYQEDIDIPFDNYVLVFGNDFKHKAIKETMQAVEEYKSTNFIFLGAHANSSSEHIVGLSSGGLSDNMISRLIDKSSMILFPSQYEGFGLPILEAANYGKPILCYSSIISSEIMKLSSADNAYSFKRFTDIPNKIDEILGNEHPKNKTIMSVRTMEQYNEEVFREITNLLNEDLLSSVGKLEKRWSQILSIQDYYYSDPKGYMPLKLKMIKFLERRYPFLHSWLKNIYRRNYQASSKKVYTKILEGASGTSLAIHHENIRLKRELKIANNLLNKITAQYLEPKSMAVNDNNDATTD